MHLDRAMITASLCGKRYLMTENISYQMMIKLSSCDYTRIVSSYHSDRDLRWVWWSVGSVAADDHTSRDCVVVAVLSHGTDSGQVFGVDGELISVDVLLDPLKHSTSLVGKPKIVIIEVL